MVRSMRWPAVAATLLILTTCSSGGSPDGSPDSMVTDEAVAETTAGAAATTTESPAATTAAPATTTTGGADAAAGGADTATEPEQKPESTGPPGGGLRRLRHRGHRQRMAHVRGLPTRVRAERSLTVHGGSGRLHLSHPQRLVDRHARLDRGCRRAGGSLVGRPRLLRRRPEPWLRRTASDGGSDQPLIGGATTVGRLPAGLHPGRRFLCRGLYRRAPVRRVGIPSR